MVVGIELAVAMRAKGGSNFLLQRYEQQFGLLADILNPLCLVDSVSHLVQLGHTGQTCQ